VLAECRRAPNRSCSSCEKSWKKGTNLRFSYSLCMEGRKDRPSWMNIVLAVGRKAPSTETLIGWFSCFSFIQLHIVAILPLFMLRTLGDWRDRYSLIVPDMQPCAIITARPNGSDSHTRPCSFTHHPVPSASFP